MPSAVPPTKKEREKSGTEADGEMKSHDIAILEKAPGPGEGKSRFSQPANGARRTVRAHRDKKTKSPRRYERGPRFQIGSIGRPAQNVRSLRIQRGRCRRRRTCRRSSCRQTCRQTPARGARSKDLGSRQQAQRQCRIQLQACSRGKEKQNSRGWGRLRGKARAESGVLFFKCFQQ